MVSVRNPDIRFGTDGWRAIIADEFTFANVSRLSRAYARWLSANRAAPGPSGGRARVLIGFDTRFLSDAFAARAAAELAGAGHEVLLAPGPVPTPAVSWAVRHEGLDGGLIVTASHNPPMYNGIKLKDRHGGPLLSDGTAGVESRLKALPARGGDPAAPLPGAGPLPDAAPLPDTAPPPAAAPLPTGGPVTGAPGEYDPRPGYMDSLEDFVDMERIAAAGISVAVDVMHGSAAGCLVELLGRHRIKVVELRSRPDPLFGGMNPEPIAANLGPLLAAVGGGRARVGLATDGDGDRVAAVDPAAGFIGGQQIFPLLLQHLVEVRGWEGKVVKTFAGSRMVERLARRYGLPYEETPIGFKHVCRRALAGDVLIGGEESGGIGVMAHMPERDGMLCALLLLEIIAVRNRSLAEQLDLIAEQVGRHFFHREDLMLTPRRAAAADELLADPPLEMAGRRVTRIDTLDGVKLHLGGEGWVLFRRSGTEPLLRIYAEMGSPEAVREVLGDALRLIGAEDRQKGDDQL